MATIDLNNLIRPKQSNYTTADVKQRIQDPFPVYVDLNLDLRLSQSKGIGTNPSISNDIYVSKNLDAIKNSLFNIFTTRAGQKLLTPDFGCSLEKFLFEPVTDIGAKIIGDYVYSSIVKYEPRITVNKVYVQPCPDSVSNSKITSSLSNVDNTEYPPGYVISVSYSVNEIKSDLFLNLAGLLGGQILF
jgi:phage baseplate assembly protein W